MRKVYYVFLVILGAVTIAYAEQHAISNNDIEVILKNDGTWYPTTSTSGVISRFGITEDCKRVILYANNTWEYAVNKDEAFGGDTIIFKPDLFPIDSTNIWNTEPDAKNAPASITRPVNISEPDYPELARRLGIEGQAVIRVLIDTDGLPVIAFILKSSGYTLLDNAALKSIKNLKFEPPIYNDKYYKVWVSIPFKFVLKHRK